MKSKFLTSLIATMAIFGSIALIASGQNYGTGNQTAVNSVGLALPSGYAVANSPVTEFGTLTVTLTGPSTATPGTGAGVGSPTATLSSESVDLGGVLTVVTNGGTEGTAATVATVTFSQALAAAPAAVVLSPANEATAALAVAAQPFATSLTADHFVIKSGGTALSDGATYAWNYVVVPSQ